MLILEKERGEIALFPAVLPAFVLDTQLGRVVLEAIQRNAPQHMEMSRTVRLFTQTNQENQKTPGGVKASVSARG
jgi:hypothetical protein